jgi:threonine synthase
MAGLIERYREYLPVNENTPIVTLNEGNTPLIQLTGPIAKKVAGEIYVKYEGLNPTGSFKDRGMTMAVSKAKEKGSNAVICASTGNTSASAAAYAARAGMKAVVLIPEGNIALGKLSQALMHGAKVVAIKGNFDQALQLVCQMSETEPITLVNSLNPFRLQGQKTAAFEICDAWNGQVPDYLAIPVGNAGNITAYWMGFTEYYRANKSKGLPKMLGFQAAGAAPIVEGRPIANPETIATAIRIGNPASWQKAVAARDESKGLIDKVTDEEIVEAYQLLAFEGIFCEPASAASVAGVLKLSKQSFFKSGQKIVCVLTGHGLKDPDRAIAVSSRPEVVEASMDAVKGYIFDIVNR